MAEWLPVIFSIPVLIPQSTPGVQLFIGWDKDGRLETELNSWTCYLFLRSESIDWPLYMHLPEILDPSVGHQFQAIFHLPEIVVRAGMGNTYCVWFFQKNRRLSPCYTVAYNCSKISYIISYRKTFKKRFKHTVSTIYTVHIVQYSGPMLYIRKAFCNPRKSLEITA